MTNLKGKINYVSLKDFVTYESVTFYPGEYLNVIIGPNGTGKSTLVAAIVLGMGGSPKVLSRSLNIGDYVKNGKQTAIIRIGIYTSEEDPESVLNFQRDIEITGKNLFSMDGTKCTHAAFLKAVSDLNIQVDNLCQFLPQDRVQDFAKQNAQELLASTQSSVCAPEVEQIFNKLKELREQQKQQGSSREGNIQKLTDYEKRNEALEHQIKVMEARNELVASLGVCNKKRAWLEFEDLYIRHQELLSDLKKANENHARHEAALRPLQEQIDQIDSKKRKYEDSIKKARNEGDQKTRDLQTLDDKHQTSIAAIAKANGDFEFLLKTHTERSRELESGQSMEKILAHDLKMAKEQLGPPEVHRQLIADVNEKMAERKAKMTGLLQNRSHITLELDEQIKPHLSLLQNKINSAQSINERKLELLRSKFEHAYRATLWLRKNQHLFKGKVYEPMLLELNVMDSNNAKYFENCIGQRDLVSFVCEQKEDMALLHQKLRNEEQLKVNMSHSPPATTVIHTASRPIADLKQFGFHAYLIDLIEGPAPILNALCKFSRIHDVPVGNDKTNGMIDRLPKDVRLFFTTNHRFKIIQSKYSTELSSISIEILGRNLMNIGIDNVALKRLKTKYDELLRDSDRLKNNRIQIEDQMKQVEEQTSDLLAERQKINEKAQHLDKCNESLRRHVQKMARLPPAIDLIAEKERVKAENQQIVKQILTLVGQKTEAYQECSKFRDAEQKERDLFEIFMQANAELSNVAQQMRIDVDKAKKLVDKIKEILEQNKRKCKEKQSEAKRLTDGTTPSDAAQFLYKEAFDRLPDVMEELLNHMSDLEGQIECISEANESVVDEFESRKQQILQLRLTIANFDAENAALVERINELHQQWHPEVLRTVSVINANFSHYMSAMRYAGEVELVHNDPLDYEQYGIQIRVKYRNNEKMQTLDRNVQSGGERAVAIAIYSLSLQQISHVPFRCVDEINQGMDSTNERKIFEMLVEQTAQPGKSQYFFVTPKLLPQLSYNDLMTVHVVLNGRFVGNATIFERWH